MSRTKKKILETTIKCISTHGIERTNARLVADKLGISQSAVFYHFPKQEMLFNSLIIQIVEVNNNLLASMIEKKHDFTNFEKLQIYVKANLKWAFEHKDHVAVLLFGVVETSHDKDKKNQIKQILREGEDKVYSFIVAGIAEKEFKIQGTPRDLAKFFHKAVIGMIVSSIYDNESSSEKYLTLFIQRMGEMFERLV